MGCLGSKGATYRRDLERLEAQVALRPWRNWDCGIGDLQKMEEVIHEYFRLHQYYAASKGSTEFSRLQKLVDKIVVELVSMMEPDLLRRRDLVTVQYLLRLAKVLDSPVNVGAHAKVEQKHRELQLRTGKELLDKAGHQMRRITAASMLPTGSKEVITTLETVHFFALDVPDLTPSFLQYCTALSVVILDLLGNMVVEQPRALPLLLKITRRIDAMCAELTQSGGHAKWEVLLPKVLEIGIQKGGELLPGKLEALEAELKKTAGMRASKLMEHLEDIAPLWLAPTPAQQAQLVIQLGQIEARISDAFDKAVEGGETNKMDALISLAKEFDDQCTTIHTTTVDSTKGDASKGDEGTGEGAAEKGDDKTTISLGRRLERKRANLTLRTLLANADGSISKRQKALDEEYAEAQAAIKKLDRADLRKQAEKPRWFFKLGRGGFKEYPQEKNAEVEKLYQSWVRDGKPRDVRERRREISIMVDSGASSAARKLTTLGAREKCERVIPRRPRCKYGEKCYRKNVEHRKEFSHPGDEDWDDEAKPAPIEPDAPVPSGSMASIFSGGEAPPSEPTGSGMREERYSLDFGLMTQTRLTGHGSGRRLIRREEGMTLGQKHTHKYYAEVLEFVKELENIFAQAEVEMRLLCEADRETISKQVDILMIAMEPQMRRFIELAVFCRDKASLKVISEVEALLGVHAERMGVTAGLKDFYLNDMVDFIAKVYTPPEPDKKAVRKWELVRLLCKQQAVGPKRLLKCRLALVKTKQDMQNALLSHLQMRIQGLLTQYAGDEAFGKSFRMKAMEVLNVAIKRSAEQQQHEAVKRELRTAMAWECDVSDATKSAGAMITALISSTSRFQWQPLARYCEVLEIGHSIADTSKRSLPEFCNLRPEFEPMTNKVLDEVLKVVTKKDSSHMPPSVSQVVDLRTKLRDAEYIKGFDDEFWRLFEPRYKSVRQKQESKSSQVAEWAIAYCEQLKIALPSWMMNKNQVEALNLLEVAVNSKDEKKIREAVVFAKQTDYTSDEKLNSLYEDGLSKLRQLKRLPAGWEVTELVGDDATAKMFKKVDMDGAEIKAVFQRAFDDTKGSIVTRDRVGAMPRRYLVDQIISVMNAESWGAYLKRMDNVAEQCKKFPGTAPCSKETWASWSGLISTQRVAEDILKAASLPELSANANEFLLFHGTKPEAADSIAQNNFDMAFACKTGLFGAGLYFAESSSKSDEYVKPDSRNRYPVIICRVTLGHINYVPHKDPTTDPGREKLESSCLGGEYHSVLGDRKKAKGTYREFVVYNHHQVYPHFIVWYKRL